MFKRFGLFIVTNLLILVMISIVWSILSQFLNLTAWNGYYPGLIVFCAVWGMGGAFISLMLSKWMAKTFHGVRLIDPNNSNPDLQQLLRTVHALAQKAGLKKMPEVGYYESPDINAFATGPSRNNSLVAVSTGLLQRMNDQEMEGVLGHEISHIANGDMVTMTLIQGVVNAFVLFFSRVLAGIIASNVEEKNRNLVRFLATIIGDIAFSLLGSLVVMAFSRYREFRADAGSARISSRANMILALRKLQAVYELPIPADESMTATLKISNRDRRGGLAGLLMSHPPLEERIKALEHGA